MTHSPAEVLRALLIADGLCPSNQVSAFACFVSSMPDEPDAVVCTYDSDGRLDGRLMRTGEVIEHPRVVIQVRSATFTAGWQKMEAIRALIDSVKRREVTVQVATYLVQNISRTSTILALGQEEGTTKRREYFSLNVLMTLQET